MHARTCGRTAAAPAVDLHRRALCPTPWPQGLTQLNANANFPAVHGIKIGHHESHVVGGGLGVGKQRTKLGIGVHRNRGLQVAAAHSLQQKGGSTWQERAQPSR